MSAPLYTIDILRLAAAIPHQARLSDPDASVERRSPACGSGVAVDVVLSDDGRVAAFGQEVRACALGQAAAAVLGAHVVGRTAEEIASAHRELADYLRGTRADAGSWPGVRILEAARPYPARHASITLAFAAAAEAVAKAGRRQADAA